MSYNEEYDEGLGGVFYFILAITILMFVVPIIIKFYNE